MTTTTHTRLRIARTRHTAATPTRSAREAAGMLGVLIDDLRAPARDHADATLELGLPTGGGVIALVGPSGSGKSTLLRDLAGACRAHGSRVIDASRLTLDRRSVLDHFAGTGERAISWLARAGLAEARCLIARGNELSEGQRFRLRLALALERASLAARRADAPPPTVLIDEFGSALDEPTAFGVSAALRRCIPGAAAAWVIIATTRPELTGPLAPDVLLTLDPRGIVTLNVPRASIALDGCPCIARHPEHGHRLRAAEARGTPARGTLISERLIIEPGTRRDYDALAPWHYRAGPPATMACVRRAIDSRTGELAGVLVVSRPVLNAQWRSLAWGERYSSGDKRRDARRLNDEVRCISRVIIDPRYRGLGAARSLVRAYLDSPLTIRTESAAAMGRISPFFAAAGMREWRLPPRGPDARLLDALHFAGIERWRAAMPRAAWRRIERTAERAFIERELRIWAGGSRRLLGRCGASPEQLLEAACRRLTDGTAAYTSDAPSSVN